jgi:hypothetical protein
VGGALTTWAVASDEMLVGANHRMREVAERLPWGRRDEVEEASADSFPASDPPSWTATVAARAPEASR